ncbi:MAG TPA: rhomboid family intramembrane serine protease [Hyphomicrobiaceae bacterium]|nr:rhomboid family intramembrane serine protease [Hyphomicrobiaceae bacterium]
MFVPIHDENPLRHIRLAWVTWAIIAINVVVLALQVTGNRATYAASFAVVPTELLGVRIFGGPANGPNDALAVPEGLTLLTYMFLHGDPLHLVGNMLFLWVFGDNVEDALGHLKFAVFYLLCGIAGGLAHAYVVPTSNLPLVGASGAVAGVIGAYLLLHPKVRLWVLVMRVVPLNISAAWALGAWILTQLVMVLLPQVGPTAWWAHIGGLAAGAALVLVLRRPGVPILD